MSKEFVHELKRDMRIFTITLNPLETQEILKSPAHLLTGPVQGSDVRFQILDRGDSIEAEELAFRLSDSSTALYSMAMPTGFRNDKAHLKYLTSLKDVPMLIESGEREVPVGYVRFKKAA